MKKYLVFLLVIVITMGTSEMIASDILINFSNTNINDARKKAGEEGKLLFIDFHAKWCTPCKWMDQTTFKDEQVAKTLNSDYISVKVDIDDVQGYELKNTYNVKYLPTMLIFNSQGQLVARIEETLSPRMLVGILNQHNAPQNKLIIKHDFNISPSEAVKDAELKETDAMMLSREEYTKYFQEKQIQSDYKVQLGVFQKYEGAQELVNKLREIFLEPISVINEFRDNVPFFKVRIGQFSTYEEAESFRKILRAEYKMDGIVQ